MYVVSVASYFLIHLYVTFDGTSNDANYNKLFESECQVILKSIKSSLSPKPADVAYKGLTKVISDVALDH